MLGDSAQLSCQSVDTVMSSNPQSSDNICQFFARGTYCKFGRRCKFLHIRQKADSDQSESCSSKQDIEHQVEREVVVGEEPLVESTPQDGVSTDEKRICSHYSRTGWCRFGKRCRFVHLKKPRANKATDNEASLKETSTGIQQDEDVNANKSQAAEPPANNVGGKQKPAQSRQRLCRFFKAGHCSMGNRCRFRHPTDALDIASDGKPSDGVDNIKPARAGERAQTGQPRGLNLRPTVRGPNPRPTVYSLDKVDDEEFEKLREAEIDQFKKRYPKADENEAANGDVMFQMMFVPSDPDWPYEVRSLPLTLRFCRGYPRAVLQVSVPDSEGVPRTLQSHVAHSCQSWIDSRFDTFSAQDKVELVVRGFFRWLDRSLEDLFTEGLKKYQKEMLAAAAGLTFVSATELQQEWRERASSTDDDGNDDEEEDDGSEYEESEEEYEDSDSESDEETSRTIVTDVSQRGTEIKLHHVEFRNALATLTPAKLCVVVQCERCKYHVTLTTPPDRVNSASCGQCSAAMTLNFRAAIVHQNSAVMGYCDVDGCQVHDLSLPECEFLAGCFTCNKQMHIQGIHTGQGKETWCRYCNAKLRLSVDSVRFLHLQPANIDTGIVHKVETSSKRRVQKDPAIQLGQPLPLDGTCKHYKKSYRWFRFPCCGKAYPCDICHEEKEDHEMKLANRMICGHCCKEQPFSADRPCSGCGLSMTKKNTTHWEGGKGCRDKVKMARGDDRKYSNCNKTVSRKQQDKKNPGKKNTKLRHT